METKIMGNADSSGRRTGHLSRRNVLAAGAALMSSILPAAWAQDKWPARVVTIVVPFTPGTTMDVLARQIAPHLSAAFGQAVIVDNRAGASGNIGTGYVANASPDGHTLLMTVSTLVMNPSLFKTVPYDPIRSFVPISRAAIGSLVLAVSSDLPAKSLAEAIQLFRTHPDKYAYASPGNGTPQHLAMELFKLNARVALRHVPYKGSAGAITDLLGGHVDAMILPANTALTHRQAGKLRVLAVLNDKRLPVMPDVPTLSEQGVANTGVDLWFGLLAPAHTPAPVIARINAEMNQVLKRPDVRDALEKQGLTVSASTPEELGKLIANESVRWAGVIKAAGITAD